MKVRWLAAGTGCAILLLSDYIWPLLSPYHLAIYHDPLSISTIVAGLAIDLGACCILFSAFLLVLSRYRSEHPVWAVFLGLTIAKLIDSTIFLLKLYGAEISWKMIDRLGVSCALVIAALVLSRLLPHALGMGVRSMQMGLALLGCCIFWLFPQLVIMAIRTHASEPNAFNRPVDLQDSQQPRVIWILLDELSYDQVYDHRQPDVKLPHFDELKRDSVVFSDVQPAGYYTDLIVPSLFIGREVDAIRSSLRRDLYMHVAGKPRWEPFNEQDTVFAEAKRLGWTTGVAGWFNPYCHILQGVLDSCYWQAIIPFPREFHGQRTILGGMAFPLDSVFSRFRASESRPDVVLQAHVQEYEDIDAAANALIRNESIHFVFLHFPVPHPEGIYNRRTNVLGSRGTYLDNLVLADKTIGNLLDVIRGTASAPQTIVIVSSDHSWRVGLWRPESSWSKEEERASGGRFDPRPFLLVHFPGSNAGEMRAEAFPELEMHGLLEAMLKGKIDSQGDLDKWLDSREKVRGQDISLRSSASGG